MPEGLAKWYQGFAKRNNLTPPPRRTSKPKKAPRIIEEDQGLMCSRCGVRRISGSAGKQSRYAQRAGLCAQCYGTRGARAYARAEKIKRNGACVKCGLRAIAGGKSYPSLRAQRMRMCGKCAGLERIEKR